MGFVDRARDDAVVRLRAELRMAAVRIVADISEEFRLARPRREDERPSRDRDEDLSRALLLDLAALLERLLVKYADHVSRPLVDDDLFLAELLPGRRHAIPALELRERDLEEAPEQAAERMADVRRGRRLWSAALRAHATGRRRIRPAVDALVAEPLRDVDGRFFGIDEIPFRARKPVLLLQDLVALFDFDEGPFRILRIVHDSDLFRHRRQMEGEGLGDHRLARAGRADQQEVPPLIRGDPGERDRLVLADDPLQRIVRDRDLRGRLKVVEGEPLIRGDHLRSRDRLHPGYGARSLRVQTSMPAGCFVIVPIFVPTTECMFISDAMSRMRCVMIPSKTTARVCFAVLSVSTSSRTGTSVTTPSPSSRRRAVEDPPSCRSMSRYFSSFGLRTFVVGVRGAGGRSSRDSRGSLASRGSGRNSGRGSGRGWGPPAAFDDDDRVAVRDVRSGGKPLGPEGHNLRDLHALTHLVEQVGPGGLRLLDHGRQERAGSLDDLVPFRDARVLDLVDLDRGLARADAVDRLERRRQDRGLDLIQRGRNQDRPFAPSFLALDVHLDSADAAALL